MAGIPLTLAGRGAAEEAAKRYEGPTPELIVVSPYVRTRQTAEPFLKLYPGAAVEEWPVQEFTYLSSALCGERTPEQRRPLVENYWKEAKGIDIHGPGAESFDQFMKRVEKCVLKLKGRQEKTILIFCHETFIKAVIWIETYRPHDRTPQTFRVFASSFSIPNLGTWDLPGPGA